MKLYDFIIQGGEATEWNAINVAKFMTWSGIPYSSTDWEPKNHRHIDTINGVGIYYNYGADYYAFVDAE